MSFIKPILIFCLFCSLIVFQAQATEHDQSKYQQYVDARKALLNKEVIISCSGFDFRYSNGIIGGESLHVRSGLEWDPIQHFETKDNGLSFNMRAGITVNDLSLFTELPEIEDIYGNAINSQITNLIAPVDRLVSDFGVELNLYSMEMKIENIEKSSVAVHVIEKRYIDSQKLMNTPDYESNIRDFSGMGRISSELTSLKFKEDFGQQRLTLDENRRKIELEESLAEMRRGLERMNDITILREQKIEENSVMARENLAALQEVELYATAHPGDVSKTYWCR